MKSYLNLIPISAKVHKRQNRMTLLCIIFAVFLVAVVFSVADMSLQREKALMIEKHGNWHYAFQKLSEHDAVQIGDRSDIAAAAWQGVINETTEENYDINGKKVVLYGVEERFLTEMSNGLTEGSYPENAKEILLSPNAGTLFDIQIGDQITVNTPAGSMNYSVSGFCETDAKFNELYDCISAYMNMAAFETLCNAAGTGFAPNYYIRFRNGVNINRALTEIKEQYGLAEESISENTGVVGLMGFSGNSTLKNLYSLAGVLFVIILIAGVLMIAGSINSNVAQRTKFFGMMRCIGMSREQIIRFVRLEALNWCKTAIPVGILLSIIVTWGICIALRFGVGDEFNSMPLFRLSPVGILSGMFTGIVTVLIAAQSPAKRAAKVSPVVAVSGNVENTQKVAHAANTGFAGIETMLGIHHAVSAKKNLILMTGSFAVSIVLFLSFSAGLDLVHALLPSLREWQPDVSIMSNDSSNHVDRGLVEEIKEIPGVAHVFGSMCLTGVPVSSDKTDTVILVSYEKYMLECAAADIVDGELSKVYGDSNDVLTIYNRDNPLKVGDVIQLNGTELHVAGALSDGLFADDVVVICPEETFTRLTGEHNYCMINIQLTDTATAMDIYALRALAGEDLFTDQRESNQSSNATYYFFCLFVYSFLAIISLITVLNIMNSISMSVSARIRQYGSMRAVGMDTGQLTRMIAAEVFTYAALGCVVGCGLGLLMNKILVETMITSHFGIAWSLPVKELGMILVIVIAASAAAVYAPAKRIQNMAVTATINEL